METTTRSYLYTDEFSYSHHIQEYSEIHVEEFVKPLHSGHNTSLRKTLYYLIIKIRK